MSRYLLNRLRSITALIMFSFVFIHLGNHSLGLIGIEAMEAMRRITTQVIHSVPGSLILLTSVLVHFTIAMRALYRKPFLNLARWQQLQLISGVLMILLLIPHAVPVRGFYQGFNVDTSYPLILQHLWLNLGELIRQFALLIVAWFHICLGLHCWLKTKRWYRKNLYWLYALAIVWPVLSLIGFIQAGNEAFDYDIVELDDPEMSATIITVKYVLIAVVIATSLLMLGLRRMACKLLYQRNACQILIAENQIQTPIGFTILNGLRFADFPHASVCGGRARCTTCRVRVNHGMENLEPVGKLEKLALTRINAPPTVRLACQAQIKGNVNITALLPTDATMKLAHPAGGLSGEERHIVAMFVDLRDSTKLAEQKLPYDVLFLLNQFFTQMSKSLRLTKGHYAQFAGDGLMALYGLQTKPKSACVQALKGALDMLKRLEMLNSKMQLEIDQPLKIGIGIHCGDAIVGSMGPPRSPNYSAIGDNINIAARLEAKTKDLDCMLVISAQVLEELQLDTRQLDLSTVSIRGRQKEMDVYAIKSINELEHLIDTLNDSKHAQ